MPQTVNTYALLKTAISDIDQDIVILTLKESIWMLKLKTYNMPLHRSQFCGKCYFSFLR